MQAFGVELSDRDVIRDDGSQIGTIHNVTFDPSTGQLKHLLVNPLSNTHRRHDSFQMNENGRYKIPAQLVQAVDDCIVVER